MASMPCHFFGASSISSSSSSSSWQDPSPSSSDRFSCDPVSVLVAGKWRWLPLRCVCWGAWLWFELFGWEMLWGNERSTFLSAPGGQFETPRTKAWDKIKCYVSLCSHIQWGAAVPRQDSAQFHHKMAEHCHLKKIIIKPADHAPMGVEQLTFVLHHVVCVLQHRLVELLGKSFWCEFLQGAIPSILQMADLLFVGRSNNDALETLMLPVLFHKFSLFVMDQWWRDVGWVEVHRWLECVVLQMMLRFVQMQRRRAGRVWAQMPIWLTQHGDRRRVT